MKDKKKKRKLKYKRIILAVLVMLLPIIILCNLNNISNIYGHFKYGYKVKTIELFKENKIYDYIKDKKYSKTLETAINSKDYDSDNIDSYYKINYKDSNSFIKNINSLLDKEYTTDEINTIYKNFDSKAVNIILKYDHNSDISNYVKLKYFKKDKLDRYLAFNENDDKFGNTPYQDNFNDSEFNYEDVITYVNANLDKDYYDAIENTDNDNILILVNRYNSLAKDYVPEDLEKINLEYADGTQKLRKEAKEKFIEMAEYLKTQGLNIIANSTYRTYEDQEELFEEYLDIYGRKYTEAICAKPGYSEHQTGLAVDVGSKSVNKFVNSKEYTWMKDNSYKYGFILRYPKEKQFITATAFESWHYRYVGIETATYIHDNDLTLEEYYGRK